MSSIDPAIIIKARSDLAQRLGVDESEIGEGQVEQTDFPDASLGAPLEDEMSAQMITPGWRIRLKVRGETYEYRATARQLRLVNFKGRNYRV
ncbi:MAG TPA: hypothetical protein VGP81_08235 [Pyrinomonadaceae bacterium]|jgi:hypothetical protein|nr:hypothetical protein [Pyrinomonadaceae bacterium]